MSDFYLYGGFFATMLDKFRGIFRTPKMLREGDMVKPDT